MEEYRNDDAEVVLVAFEHAGMTARVAIDRPARERVSRLGLLRLRLFRPFPADAVRYVLAGKRAVPGAGSRLLRLDITASFIRRLSLRCMTCPRRTVHW